jgi:hypothetical protein
MDPQEKLDLIADDVVLYGDAIFEGDNCAFTLETLITETLLRLPDDVYEELMHGYGRPPVEFFGCGPSQLGQTIRWRHMVPPRLADEGDFIERVAILLSGEPCRLPLKDAMFTVPHELAHTFLKHDTIHSVPGGTDWRAAWGATESAADELAHSWGFSQ